MYCFFSKYVIKYIRTTSNTLERTYKMGNTENITLAELLTPDMIPFIIGMIVGLAIVAFFGFKLLRIELVIAGAIIGYSIGSTTLVALVGDSITGVNIALILGIVCAVIGVLLSAKVYRLMIFVYGGLIGYVVGTVLFPGMVAGFTSLPVSAETLVTVMSVVVGIIFAFVIYRLFKPLYIISTSIFGMLCVGTLTLALISGGNETASGIGAIVGLVIGVFAMIHQFKANRDKFI